MLAEGDYKFQFHKGTIKTVLRLLLDDDYPYFNSIKVRLKLMSDVYYQLQGCNFNSIKVRLKRAVSDGFRHLI